MELVELYKSILASLNVFASEDGSCFMDYGDGKQHPIVIDGKSMVLPTREVLNHGLGDQRIAFHPLSENIQRGESPVIRKLKLLINARLTQVISDLLEGFVAIASNSKLHAKLSPSQKEVLLALPDADERTVNDLGKIYDALSEDARRKLVSIYLRRGGTLRLEKFARVAVIRFPILGEFENEDRTIYGVKLRKADYSGFPKLFEFMLPSSDGDNSYSYGSNDMYVPYLDALLNAFWLVADRLNKMVDMFKKHLPSADRLRIDTSWAVTMKEQGWAKFRDALPALEGNEGTTASEEANEAPAPAAIAPAPHRAYDPSRAASANVTAVRAPAAQVASQATAPTKPRTTANGAIPWEDIVAAQQRRSLPAGPVYAQPAAAVPQPAMIYPAPQAQLPPPPGFGPPPGPPPVDAYGRPMPGMVGGGAPMMVPQGMAYPQQVPPGYQMPPPGFGPPQGGMMVDAYGRPMAAPQPQMMGPQGQPGGRTPTYGIYQQPQMAPQPVMVDQYGRQVMAQQPMMAQPGMGMPVYPGYPQPGAPMPQAYPQQAPMGMVQNPAMVPIYGMR